MESTKKLNDLTEELIEGAAAINDERKALLDESAKAMAEALHKNGKHATVFVCTHNSRRSHLSDLWFRYALLYYGIEGMESFSGGTEATAFNKRAIAAMERAGFKVSYDKSVANPLVQVSPMTYPVWTVFSKVYSHESNPKSNFTAIMVCSDADHNCPIVDGATQRFAIPYNDPKHYDDTPAEEGKYDETVKLIGTEMMYMANRLKLELAILNK
ncbi:MAG: hypothetical protein RL266_1393 [Bacteroidota bacterium]